MSPVNLVGWHGNRTSAAGMPSARHATSDVTSFGRWLFRSLDDLCRTAAFGLRTGVFRIRVLWVCGFCPAWKVVIYIGITGPAEEDKRDFCLDWKIVIYIGITGPTERGQVSRQRCQYLIEEICRKKERNEETVGGASGRNAVTRTSATTSPWDWQWKKKQIRLRVRAEMRCGHNLQMLMHSIRTKGWWGRL